MKIYIPHLIVLTNQPIGCMFPTQDLFTVTTIFLMIEVLEHLIATVDPKGMMLQSSTQWDARRRFQPTLLYGNGIRGYESEEVDTYKSGINIYARY